MITTLTRFKVVFDPKWPSFTPVLSSKSLDGILSSPVVVGANFVARSIYLRLVGSGLGKILAKAFLVNGASVTLVDIRQERLDEAAKELASLKEELSLPGQVRTYVKILHACPLLTVGSVQGDVGSKGGIESILSTIRGFGFQTIDTLIMAAGIRKTNQQTYTPGQSIESLVQSTRSLDWDDLETSFRVNVYSQYYLTAGLLDLIGASNAQHKGRGSVICFSSVASQHTAQFVPAYQTSKAAVDHMVKIMAAEFADQYSK